TTTMTMTMTMTMTIGPTALAGGLKRNFSAVGK
ncbi:MAG: hypothetical protein ACJATF_001930, partial [Flavobacteriales bacterium]